VFDLTYPQQLKAMDAQAHDFYEGRAQAYDQYLHLTFSTYGENEHEVRNEMIDKLQLKADSKVLEIACGTGRDSVLLESRLGNSGELHISDISEDMLLVAIDKLKTSENFSSACIANALYLPYPDNYFDAFYSFGALGEFSDIPRFFREVVRVCKPGAKVVVGDENLPVWQRDSEFGRILANYNKQFLSDVPFEALPIEARKVNCKWIIGGVFYLIDFEVGEGEPYADFDFTIPGQRGGTHKTRFYGQLEGVSEQAKALAYQAQQKSGKSMFTWLDELVKAEAKKQLGE
jgi:ubiquinone/menaquinone biosynthesis C-methylase UbiE